MEFRPEAPPHFSELRRANGISLEMISHRTKIPVSVLEDIEHERFDRMPRGIFARSYVRDYAREAELDPDVVLARVIAKLPGDEALARVDETLVPLRRSNPAAGRPTSAMAALAGLIVVVGLWFGRPASAPLLDARPVATAGVADVAGVQPSAVIQRTAPETGAAARPVRRMRASSSAEQKHDASENVFSRIGGTFKKIFGGDDDKPRRPATRTR